LIYLIVQRSSGQTLMKQLAYHHVLPKIASIQCTPQIVSQVNETPFTRELHRLLESNFD
jgi:hypothetical protein